MNSSRSIGALTPHETGRSACGYGSARNKIRSTTLNTAVEAPIPSASVRTATTVKPGFFASVRIPYRKSWMRFVITHRSVVRAIPIFDCRFSIRQATNCFRRLSRGEHDSNQFVGLVDDACQEL